MQPVVLSRLRAARLHMCTPDITTLSEFGLRERVSRLVLARVIPVDAVKALALTYSDIPDPVIAAAPTSILAAFHPRAWIDEDHFTEVEPVEDNRWLVSSYALTCALDAHRVTLERLLDEPDYSVATDARESLKRDPLAPLWVRAWQGPFAVSVKHTSGWTPCPACAAPRCVGSVLPRSYCWRCGHVQPDGR